MNGAPRKFWCYCVAHTVDIMNHTASKRLQWKTPYEAHYGDTPDISVFRFEFWEPIYYHEPHAKFPTPNLLPGRFLGIARTTGDTFTFYIYTQKPKGRNMILTRSVIRKRHLTDPDHQTDYSEIGDSAVTIPTPEQHQNNVVSITDDPQVRTAEQREHVSDDHEQNHDQDPRILQRGRRDVVADILRLTTEENGESKDELIQKIIDMDPEEIIFGDRTATYEGRDEDTGEHILHMEDGEYTRVGTEELYNHLCAETKAEEIDHLISHHFSSHTGKLYVQVEWDTGETSLIEAEQLKLDEPVRLAKLIQTQPVERTRTGHWNKWANTVLRNINRSTRRLSKIYETNGKARRVLRRTNKHQSSKFSNEPVITFGVLVPKDPKEALELDKKNGDHKWADSMKVEIDGIQDHKTLEFLPPGATPPKGYQYAKLRMIFDVKHDLRRKSRLVIGGHKVDATGHSVYSSVVQLASVRLLNVIAKSQGLQCIAGDVGNAYLNAYTEEKVYVICGPEFGPELEGRIAIVRKGLYGLKTSGNRWHAHFAQTLYGMGFIPTRFDPNVWLKKREDEKGYDYISTYVDDFLITAKNPWPYMEQLQNVYKIKNPEECPTNYLGATYVGSPEEYWTINCKAYIKEALTNIERIHNEQLREEKTPCTTNDHPEEDESPIVNNKLHRQYQSFIGMAQWLVTLGRIDICYTVSSLSRFCAAPREGHYKRLLRLWGYLKKYPDKALAIDARDPIFDPKEPVDFEPDFEDQYGYAKEELDPMFPEPLGDELTTSIFFDSDHAHDKVTGRSISGTITMVGRTPIVWKSRRQGAIATSTYGAEFSAMRLAVEEAYTIRYMLRALGIKIEKPCYLYGDNLGVIQNASTPEGVLKKKHVALSFHFVREAVATRVIMPRKVGSPDNFADMLTKPLDKNTFMGHVGGILWMTATMP